VLRKMGYRKLSARPRHHAQATGKRPSAEETILFGRIVGEPDFEKHLMVGSEIDRLNVIAPERRWTDPAHPKQ
jgi:hypothetical protein